MTPPVNRLLVAVAALAAATPALGQSMPQGFYIKGHSQIEYLFDANPNRNFITGDLSLGITPQDAPFALPLGFDIGIKGFRSNRGDLSESVLYGAVGLWTEMGTFWAGAPRPATSSYFPLPRIGGSQAYAAFAGTGVTTTDTIALFDNAGQVGLRYDYTVDDVTVGLSYHDFTDNSTDTFTGVVAWDTGPFLLAVGAEHASAPGVNKTDFSGRLVYDVEQWGFSLLWSSTSVIDTKTFAADAFYALRDDIRFTASYATFDVDDEKDKVYGVSAEYIFPNRAYVGVGITDSDIADLDAGYNAFLGYRFDY